jgi:hypothetical protein
MTFPTEIQSTRIHKKKPHRKDSEKSIRRLHFITLMNQYRIPVVKAKFEPWEDARLLEVVRAQGPSNWHEIAAHFPGRNARQCRERWTNYANPALLKSEWTETEDQILMQTYRQVGPKWFVIAGFLPGRAKNSVKNRYFTLQRRTEDEIGSRSEHPIAPHPTPASAQASVQAPAPAQANANGINDGLAWTDPLQYDPILDWGEDQGDAFGFYL